MVNVSTAARRAGLPLLLSGAALLGACASPDTLVQGPVQVMPAPDGAYVERVNNGAIYQPGMAAASLFTTERRARQVGDSLKVAISESLSATQKSKTDTSRDNKLAVHGPGGQSRIGAVERLLNIDATAAGSDSFKGSGTTETDNSFTTTVAVSVINVLPNGNLLVAGERNVGLNKGVNTLRFSGIVNPRDIRPGNLVSSRDVVNASLESVAQGDVSEASSRSWLQRVLARSLSIW